MMISSDCFARAVELDFIDTDCKLSENFFDITSAQPRCVFAKTDYTAEQLEQELIIRTTYDIG